MRPLSDGFSTYASSQFTLIRAVATSLDPSQRTVSITPNGKERTEAQQLHYDSLIISTGTTSASPLWTLHHDQSLTSAALKSMYEILPTVKTILIAGGGPVGVETAAKLPPNIHHARSHYYPAAPDSSSALSQKQALAPRPTSSRRCTSRYSTTCVL